MAPCLLLINFPLIKEGHIQYGNLALGEALTLPIGIGLWILGLRLWRVANKPKRVGGAAVLLLATSYTLGWLGVNGLIIGSALGWL